METSPDQLYYREWILEAIDKLRERKARPDAERISILLKRYHNITPTETQHCLNSLADLGVIVCVDYKGNVSYRNPSKWRKTSSGGGCVLNTPSVSQQLIAAVTRLTEIAQTNTPSTETPIDDAEIGSAPAKDATPAAEPVTFSIAEIEETIKILISECKVAALPINVEASNPAEPDSSAAVPSKESSLIGASLRTALDRECAYGGLARRPNGRYLLDVDGEQRKLMSTEAKKLTFAGNNMSSYQTHTKLANVKRGRPPGSKKKKSENGSDQPPKKKPKKEAISLCPPLTGVETYKTESESCSKCGSTDIDVETMLQCKDCALKAHPTCLGYWPELANRVRQFPWQCSKCKTCSICNDFGADANELLICDCCDQAFHQGCHRPLSADQLTADGSWMCSQCHTDVASAGEVSSGMPGVQDNSSFDYSAGDHHPQTLGPYQANYNNSVYNASTEENHNFNAVSMENNQAAIFPESDVAPEDEDTNCKTEEARRWSVNDVYQWLLDEGFPKEARAFRDQEIDGASLMLMKRMDVLTQLGIKLGPAVKIYERIKKFQSRSSWAYADLYT